MMILLMRTIFLRLLLCFPGILVLGYSGSIQGGMDDAVNIQREALSRLQNDFLGPPSEIVKRVDISSTITFHNPKAKDFFVDGTTLPEGQDP
jgi:carboxypeptidase D